MNEVVAANVRAARKSNGWTQTQLAEAMRAIGVPWSRPICGYIEAGERPVNAEELLALSVVFETHPSFWLAPPAELFVNGDFEVGLPKAKVRASWLVAAAAAGDAASGDGKAQSSWTRFYDTLARIAEKDGLTSSGARELHRTLARLRAVSAGED